MNLVLPKYSQLKPHGRIRPLALIGFAACFMLPVTGTSQSQKTDIRPNANQLIGDEIRQIFSGQTHSGSYNFNSEGVARSGYIESHADDGRVFYEDGEVKSEGAWYVTHENLCFVYKNEALSGGCFRVYRIKNCFYYYSSNIPQRDNELGRDYWVARSTPKGETPNCDPAIG